MSATLQLDAPSLLMLDSLYPGFRDDLVPCMTEISATLNINMRLTAGFRSITEQENTYNQGRTTPGPIVTHAQGFESFHNYGLAADFCFRGPDPYLIVTVGGADMWKKAFTIIANHGLTSGSTFEFPDNPHIENKYGLYWENCQSLTEDNGISALWSFLDRQRGVANGYDWKTVPALYSE